MNTPPKTNRNDQVLRGHAITRNQARAIAANLKTGSKLIAWHLSPHQAPEKYKEITFIEDITPLQKDCYHTEEIGTNGTHHIGRGGLNWSLLVKGLQLGVFTQAA